MAKSGIDYSKWDRLADAEDAESVAAPPDSLFASMPRPALGASTQMGQFSAPLLPPPPPSGSSTCVLLPGETSRIRSLPQTTSEVWQVVVYPLRCWVAIDSTAATSAATARSRLVQPLCIFVGCLHPHGSMVARHVCKPSHRHPTHREVAEIILRAILDPAHEGVPQHRPKTITFVDEELCAGLAPSFAACGIETEQLSLATGFQAFADGMVQMLVDGGMAVRDTSERPPLVPHLHSVPDHEGEATVAHVRQFLKVAAAFTAAAPWRSVPGRQAIRAHIRGRKHSSSSSGAASTSGKGGVGGEDLVWIKVMGEAAADCDTSTSSSSSSGEEAGASPSRALQGIAVFTRRVDLELKELAEGAIGAAHPLDDVCAACGVPGRNFAAAVQCAPAISTPGGWFKPHVDIYNAPEEYYARLGDCAAGGLLRCTSCRRAWYCSQACQRAHWKAHSAQCKVEKGHTAAGGGEELATLLVEPPSLPFEDAELYASLGSFDVFAPDSYPLPIAFLHGASLRPDARGLQLLATAMQIVLCMVAEHASVVGNLRPSLKPLTCVVPASTSVDSTTCSSGADSSSPTISVDCWIDPILSKEQAEALWKVSRARQVAATNAAASKTTAASAALSASPPSP